MPARKTRKRFVHRPLTADMLEQRFRQSHFEDDLAAAYRGDIEPLRQYLLDVRLSPHQQQQLAEFLHRRRAQLRHDGKRDVPNPVRDAERAITHTVRKLRKRRYGNRKLPRGTLDKLIEEVIVDMNAHDMLDDLPGQFNFDSIRRDLKRGRSKAE
jgi:hypothetical protein